MNTEQDEKSMLEVIRENFVTSDIPSSPSQMEKIYNEFNSYFTS